MQKALDQVTEFHKAFDHPINLDPMPKATPTKQELGRARTVFVEEEIREIKEAFEADSLAGVADGLADLRYFVLGSAVAFGTRFPPELTQHMIRKGLEVISEQHIDAFYYDQDNSTKQACNVMMAEIIIQGLAAFYGIPMDACWELVHSANMAKLGPDGKPILNPDTGKVVKPEGWVPPDLSLIVGNGPPIAGASIGGDDELLMVPRMPYILALSAHSRELAAAKIEPPEEETVTMTKSAYIALRLAADSAAENIQTDLADRPV